MTHRSKHARAIDLLLAKLLLLKNLPTSTRDGGKTRLFVLVTLGMLIWALLYGASFWFFKKTIVLEPIGEILIGKMFGMTFMVLFAMLLFSNTIAVFSSFLLADDLQFLHTRPIPPYRFYAARYTETTLNSSWMVLLFGLAVFLAAGQVFRAPLDYYLWLLLVLIPFVLIPTSLAVVVVMLLANLFPVQRSREALILFGTGLFVALFVTMRSLAPAEFFHPKGFGSSMEFFASLQTPGSYWLPSSWASEILFPILSSAPYRTIDWLHLGVLYSTAAGLYFIGGWSYRALSRRAFTRAQEGQHHQVGHHHRRSEEASQALKKIKRWAKQKRTGQFTPFNAITLKDAIIFTRDTVQWSQLMMIGAIMIIYLVNFRYIGLIQRGGIFGPIGVYFLNIGLGAFLVAALSVRIVFPAVSLEGRAFWLIKQAPLSLGAYLRAKWVGHTPHMLVLALALTLASNYLIGTPLWLSLKSALVISILVITLTGLGIGIGAVFPRFHADNATKIATGIGGILFMLIAILETLVVIVLDAYPTYHLMLVAHGYREGLPDGFWLKAIASWGGALTLCLGSALFALHRGAKKLSAT